MVANQFLISECKGVCIMAMTTEKQSKVKNNTTALKSYIASMDCAIDKAISGSDCEDGYFIEKLERMANRLGYNLVEKKDLTLSENS